MIGGTRGAARYGDDARVPGGIVSKVGAEGVYTAGVLPCERWPRGLGLALKIEDGEDRRARPTVVIESCANSACSKTKRSRPLAPYASFTIRNHRGDTVGEVRANFEFERLSKIFWLEI